MTQSISNSNGSIKLTTKPLFKADEAAKQVEQLKKSFDAPVVKTVKQGLVPAPKAAKTSLVKKAGRIVGISADENKFIRELFAVLIADSNYTAMTSSEAFKKIEARYNK